MSEAEPSTNEEDFAESFSFLADARSCLESPELRRSIASARTWVLTLAIMASCWLGLVGVLLLGGALMSRNTLSAKIIVLALGIILVIAGPPVLLMFQYTARSRRFLATSNLPDLLSTLQAQRWLWNVLGIYGVLIVLFNVAALSLRSLGFIP